LHEQAAPVRPSLACAVGFTLLRTKVDDDGFFSFGCGLDVVF
jgi:hypothetical protein